ncbi:hypothetical protein [Streptomyces sp. NPDC056361]|uniref:hypothetical protein n=1 Tax=Streptomyces sp. NPDC056361 TaxID=3345795 RepID=UPI0035DA5368
MSRHRRTALVLLATTLALTGCGRLYELPPPEGKPILLKRADLLTTWTDADDGTITLKPDGTFVAHDICVAVSWDEGLAWSGTGTWRLTANKEQSFLRLRFDDAHPEASDQRPDAYSALRHNDVVKLWTRVGDPDHDLPHCTLTPQAN